MKTLLVILIAVSFASCSKPAPLSPQFYNGEILLPDYLHDDTLIVVDADFLNKEMPKCEGSDESIMELLCVTSEPINNHLK